MRSEYSLPPMKMPFRSLVPIALGGAWLALGHAADRPTQTAPPGEVPCKVHQTVAPIFPTRLLAQGVVHGEVQLLLEVDPAGKLADALVTAYTRREFADEAMRVAKQWRFDPGLAGDRPVVSILSFTFNFETAGTVAIQKHGVSLVEALPAGSSYAYQPCGVATLDRQPAAIKAPGPVYPKEWIQQGRAGSVVIDFFIDETGQARLPIIRSPADEFLAAAAVAAVKRWRFEPPTRHGQPVLARAQQQFDFDPKAAGKTNS